MTRYISIWDIVICHGIFLSGTLLYDMVYFYLGHCYMTWYISIQLIYDVCQDKADADLTHVQLELDAFNCVSL